MKDGTKTISINIWDDYYEDDNIPMGEKQQCHIYVEDSEIPHQECKKYLEYLLDHIGAKSNLQGVKLWLDWYDSRIEYPHGDASFHFNQWEIKVENLTHLKREELVAQLSEANLSYDGIPFNIYSES